MLANEHVRALRGAGAYSLSDPDWALNISGSVRLGLDALNAHSGSGDSDFKKLVLQGQYNRLLDAEWVVRLKAVTQLAGSRLPITELYALGGPDFGRAFLAATALGDSALVGSAEIAFDPNALPDFLTGSEAFLFADDGATWFDRRPATNAVRYTLASAGGGIRVPVGGKTRLELAVADAISANAPGTRAGSWRLLFGLSGSF